MALDIIKEQRMIRTLFYSLIKAADLITENKNLSEEFVDTVQKYVRERVLLDDSTKEITDVADELLETLGWKNSVLKIDESTGTGKISLGKNRYIVKEIADTKGILLLLKALFEGIGYNILKGPVEVKASISLSSGSQYEVEIKRKARSITQEKSTEVRSIEHQLEDPITHSSLTIDSMFGPIFSRRIPDVLLFDTAWKVISESLVANYSTNEDDPVKEILKNESEANLSRLILKLTENQLDEDISNLSELVGEFIVKILSTKVNIPLLDALQTTLRDRHLNSYLIYYECRKFCANKTFEKRCTFIRNMWVGILSEIFGIPMTIKDVLHAGKRDTYCMVEIIPKKSES